MTLQKNEENCYFLNSTVIIEFKGSKLNYIHLFLNVYKNF